MAQSVNRNGIVFRRLMTPSADVLHHARIAEGQRRSSDSVDRNVSDHRSMCHPNSPASSVMRTEANEVRRNATADSKLPSEALSRSALDVGR
jgi:hypothetical protein